MKMLQTGDKCPICGQPIKTTDPNKLIFLSAVGWYQTTIEAPNVSSDYCGGNGSTGATNADKLRSLPDEALAGIIMCPGVEFGGAGCREIDPAPDAPEANCTECCRAWISEPFIGWEGSDDA